MTHLKKPYNFYPHHFVLSFGCQNHDLQPRKHGVWGLNKRTYVMVMYEKCNWPNLISRYHLNSCHLHNLTKEFPIGSKWLSIKLRKVVHLGWCCELLSRSILLELLFTARGCYRPFPFFPLEAKKLLKPRRCFSGANIAEEEDDFLGLLWWWLGLIGDLGNRFGSTLDGLDGEFEICRSFSPMSCVAVGLAWSISAW